MAYKSSNSIPSHSARRTSTFSGPPSPPSPPPSVHPSNCPLSMQHAPSARDHITSGPAFEISRTVNITVEVSSSSAPAYNGYDVRNYVPPVTTTCYSTGPSSSSASTSSYQYSMYESNLPNYSPNPPPSADTTAPPSSPLHGYTPSTSSTASTDYSYYGSEHYGSQSEYLDDQPQENQTRRVRQGTRSHASTPRRM